MGKPFKKITVRYHTADGARCTADTPGAVRSEERSRKYYGAVGGRQVPLCSDYQRSKQLLSKLETDGVMQAHGIGVYDQHHRRPLADHLDDWEKFLTSKNSNLTHARQTVARARKVMTGCEFTFINEVNASAVQGYTGTLREQGLSIQTVNFYLKAAKQFFRWLVRDRRTGSNPLEHLQGGNVRTDRRHDRRELSAEELAYLLAVTRTGPTVRGLTGADREMLYRVALGTGLRAKELHSLTPASLALADDPPTVTVLAAYSKNKRTDTLPIHPDLADRLRAWTAGRQADAPLWPGKWARDCKGGQMFKADLARARAAWIAEATSDRTAREEGDFLAYCDRSGRYADLHACRHTYISGVVRSGATPRVAQSLARHSTITLTMDRYSHTALHDLNSAVQALPVVPEQTPVVEAKPMRKTGTDGDSGCTLVAQSPCNQGHSGASTGNLNSINEEGAASPQPLAESPSSIDCHPQSSSTPDRTRTCNLRFRRPTPSDRNPLPDQGVASEPQVRLHTGCTDATLDRLASLWPSLPEHVRKTIAMLAEAGADEETK